MKVLHSYCLNHNLGDYYLGIGVKSLLRHYLPVELIAETNLQGTVFSEYYIENVVNKKYDMLVIGGGGVIHGAHWPNGWFWLIKKELIKYIKIPFIVYGVGYNYFSEEKGIPEVGKAHLEETIRNAAYFSIRNDGSLARFREQMGFEVPVVPDPGFHINLNRTYRCEEAAPFVLVQLANDKPEYRFAGDGLQEKFIAEMRTVISALSQKYKVILSPHVREDVELSEKVSTDLSNVEVWNFAEFAFDRAEESVGFYEKAEFVIAMRGHGQIVPMAFNTPVISIENHPKHVGLMRELGLENFNVSVRERDFGARLLEKIEILEKNLDSYREHLRVMNTNLAKETMAAFDDIRKAVC